jgi:hypothetical protein
MVVVMMSPPKIREGTVPPHLGEFWRLGLGFIRVLIQINKFEWESCQVGGETLMVQGGFKNLVLGF